MSRVVELTDALTLPEILDQLADIDVPPPVSYAPETMGWSIVLVATIGLLALLIRRVHHRRRQNRYRRVALAQLDDLQRNSGDAPETLREVAALVRRTALTVFPREQVAHLHGGEWQQFLCDHSAVDRGPDLETLVNGPYVAHPDPVAASAAVADAVGTARRWIVSHRV